jgi:hypothetical protein
VSTKWIFRTVLLLRGRQVWPERPLLSQADRQRWSRAYQRSRSSASSFAAFIPERGLDVDSDEVAVPVPRGVLLLGYVMPLPDRLPDRQVGLGLPVLIEPGEQAGQDDLGGVVARRRLPLVPLLASQRVDADVDDRLEAARWQLPDVPARAATGRHGTDASAAACTNHCTRRAPQSSSQHRYR